MSKISGDARLCRRHPKKMGRGLIYRGHRAAALIRNKMVVKMHIVGEPSSEGEGKEERVLKGRASR